MVIEVRKIMGQSVPMMRAAKQSIRAWYSPDLSKHDQLMTLLETYHKVHIDPTENSKGGWENYGDTLSWCLKHCQGKFRDVKQGDGLDWYFEIEEDATIFALKWA